MIEPVRCICGAKAQVQDGEGTAFGPYVVCGSGEISGKGAACWFGPNRKTKRGAIAAWNRVMTK